MITTEQRQKFEESGYLILKSDAISELKRKVADDFKMLSLFFCNKYQDYQLFGEQNKGLSFSEFLDKLCAFEKNLSFKLTPILYEVFPKYHSCLALLSNPFVLKVCDELGMKLVSPSTVPVSRIDRPGNNFYDTPWHQDGWYTLFSPNAVTFWVPVVNLRADMGLMNIVPGTHRAGVVPFRKFEEGYEPYVAIDSEKYEQDKLEVMVGEDEMLVFNQYLLHKSGRNTSQSCRVSLQLRFNDLSTMNTSFSTFTPVHSKHVFEKQNELLKQWANR